MSGPLARFGAGLLHGTMPPAEKVDVTNRFSRGEIGVLVSTTVIEVGIDVPEATIMVVVNAERFGLSQLHQLRGRVGRGGGTPGVSLSPETMPGGIHWKGSVFWQEPTTGSWLRKRPQGKGTRPGAGNGTAWNSGVQGGGPGHRRRSCEIG